MKKILFTLAIPFLAAFSAFAGTVSRSDAQAFAKQHFGGSADVNYVWGDEQTRSDDAPAFYVFNNPKGGWVIISGEDCTCPVLGYSNTGSFKSEGMPSNVRSWFNGVRKNIYAARKAGLTPSASARAKWLSVGSRTRSSAENLLTTADWDQIAPYNDTCKTYCSGKAVYTGCVATAMAIVIRYHQWPAKGVGTTSSYKSYTNNYSIPARNLAHTFNYSNMPLTDGSSVSWTPAQKGAVAQLMFDCGAMVQMDYDPTDGSAAYSTDIVTALTSHMCYASSAREVYRMSYTNSEWFAILKAEIDADAPVLYGGASGDDGGHEFVIDGYDSDNNVHVNWGWGGSDNGYFPVCYLEGSGYVFSDYDSAIIGLRKGEADQTYSANADLHLDSYMTLGSGTVAKGSTFTLTNIEICNVSYYKTYSGTVKAALCDRFGAFKEYIGTSSSISIAKTEASDYNYPSATVSSISCKISSSEVALGDRIVIYYQLADNSWVPCGAASSVSYGYIPVSSDASAYKAGQTFYLDVIPQLKEVSSTTWYVNGTSTSSEYITLKSGNNTLKAVVKYSDGTTETLVQVIKAN